MPAKRLKPTAILLANEAELHSTVDEICKAQLDLEQLTLTRDKEIAEVQERYKDDLKTLQDTIKLKLAAASDYAEKHKGSLFGKLKSATCALGSFGFRTGQPKLALLLRRETWEDVIARLKAADQTHLIRTKEEADKQLLIKLTDDELAALGLSVSQDETFFVEPHREKTSDAVKLNATSV